MTRTDTALARAEEAMLDIPRARDFLARVAAEKDIWAARDFEDKVAAIAAYQASCGATLEAQNEAADVLLQCKAVIGRLLAPPEKGGIKRAGKGNPKQKSKSAVTADLPTLPQLLGVADKNEAAHRAADYQKVAAIPEETRREIVAAIKAEASAGNHAASVTQAEVLRRATHTSGADDYDGDEWYTPKEYIDLARKVMGGIDLDPATHRTAQKVVEAKTFYTKDEDGLAQEWAGKVFLNPPYSYPLVERFTTKLIAEHEAKRVTQAVLLVNNCTDAGWFHALLERYAACFTRGRISFEHPSRPAFATRQGQVFFYLGVKEFRFAKEFSSVGCVVGKVQE